MNIVTGVCLILGCFLGAGFVSGREIAFYFGRFNSGVVISIIVVTILFFLFTSLFLFLSDKFYSFDRFSKYCFGKGAGVISFLLALSLLILCGSMLAGTNSLAKELNISNIVLTIFTLILTFFIVKGNCNSITKINNFLVPFLIIIMLLVSLGWDKFKLEMSFNIRCLFSGVSYVFINITTLGIFILEIGHRFSIKEKLLIALISSIVVSVLLLFITRAIVSQDLISEIMPNLTLSTKNPTLYFLMQLSIYFGLLTSFIANVFTLSNYINRFVKSGLISILVTLVLSVIVSVIGFELIVGYVYSVIGVVGFLIVLGGIIKEKRKGKVPFPNNT